MVTRLYTDRVVTAATRNPFLERHDWLIVPEVFGRYYN